MKLVETISCIKTKIQAGLFPHIQQCTRNQLADKQKRPIMTLEAVEIERHVTSSSCQWMGWKLKERYAIARAFDL